MNQAKRYNVFDNFHQGLRTMLLNLGMQWQQTNFTSGASDIVADLENILNYHEELASYKDQFILGNIIWHEPHIAASFEEDNLTDHQLSNKLSATLSALKDASTENKKRAAAAVFDSLNSFITYTLYQANKEETMLLPLLWKHFSDAEIMGMEQLVATFIHPPLLANESSLRNPSRSLPEINKWTYSMQNEVLDFCI